MCGGLAVAKWRNGLGEREHGAFGVAFSGWQHGMGLARGRDMKRPILTREIV